MLIHHLNCISSCPLGGRLMDARTPSILRRGELCCHCLLIETEAGLVLVDTGFGLRDIAQPRERLSGFFLALLSPDFRPDMTAIRQIERLGFKAADVRHIVLTHLDFDHAGGLDDFPQARIHLLAQERSAAEAQASWMDRQRFRPHQWGSRARWRTYDRLDGERWFGFERVQPLDGLPPEIALVPLIGHTLGHCGVAVKGADRWLLQAGDAYFFHRELDATSPYCTPGLKAYQWMLDKDRVRRVENQARLRELKARRSAEVDIVCAHDPIEFERVSGRSIRLPAEMLPATRAELRA